MKNLIIVIALALFAFAANAQSSTDNSTEVKSSTTKTEQQCHSATKSGCCSGETSATLSSSHNDAGAVETKGHKKKHKKDSDACTQTSGGKSCCEGMSKSASSANESEKQATPPSENSPK